MKSKELSIIIDKAIIEKAIELDLRENQLHTLPAKVGQLTKLTWLSLKGNELSTLPAEIGQLANLTKLFLDGNQLSTLPAQIGKLTNLIWLSLDGNQLSTLPAEIGKLKNLIWLSLDGNELSTLPAEIGQLTNLTRLFVEGNQLSTLPAQIGKLKNLEELSFRENQLRTLPAEIGQLKNLTSLSLGVNQLRTLPAEIGQLKNLRKLSLRVNQLSTLPAEIGQLKNLEELSFERNQLSKLPAEIGQLTNLKELDLNGNQLPIPPEILHKKNDPATIINFYCNQLASDERIPLNEAKMILVGQGGVGKTSLIERLLYNKFDPQEPKTEGINIQHWSVNSYGKDIHLNVWDFGGQEIMHATHQFFLTKRSLYLLVLNARQDEYDNRIEYWLKLIRSYGGNAPVIVVINKCDDEKMADIDHVGLQRKYYSICGFIETSCKTEHGISKLAEKITKEVGQLEHIRDELPANWFEVKRKIEALEDDYISYKDYEKLCRSHGVMDELSQRTLVGFLHDLGIALNFREDKRLQDTNILNPEWVTNGVYRILNHNPLFQAKGVLDREMLSKILASHKYPSEKHLFVMDMMRKFELCFDFEGFANERFLIPDLLPKEEPYTGDWPSSECLGFQYHYNVLPGSIMSRFIVRSHNLIHKKTYWRNGVVIAREGNRALVKADREERVIYIWIEGPVQSRREFLAIIRNEFDYIHSTISKLEPMEKVPLPDHPDVVVSYQHLLTLDEKGESKFIPEGLSDRVSIKKLLDGIEPAEKYQQRRKDQQEDRAREKHIPDINITLENIGNPQVLASLKAEQTTSQQQTVTQEVKTIQGLFKNLKEDIFEEMDIEMDDEKEKKRIQNELNKTDKAFKELEKAAAEGQKELDAGTKNRLGEFIDNLSDENSRINKALKLVSSGTKKIQQLGRIYNKIAPYFTLPNIPPVLLGNGDK